MRALDLSVVLLLLLKSNSIKVLERGISLALQAPTQRHQRLEILLGYIGRHALRDLDGNACVVLLSNDVQQRARHDALQYGQYHAGIESIRVARATTFEEAQVLDEANDATAAIACELDAELQLVVEELVVGVP